MATSPFQYQVYDTNGATARQNVLNQMKASNEAQNNLASQAGGQSGGDSVTVPHFNTGRDVGPVNANTNISGFGSLPGGGRSPGGFGDINNKGFWWTSTPDPSVTDKAYVRSMQYNFDTVLRDTESNKYGFSVRCVKN